MIAGDLIAWKSDGKYELASGQFHYCFSEDHLGDVIVGSDYNEKTLRDFINSHQMTDSKKQYYLRIAPRVWNGKIYGAPLPFGESILVDNLLYSNLTRERPAFPALNRMSGLNLLQQFRRLFQIRFLIHHGFSQTIMTMDLMNTIEENFKEIFLSVCDEETTDRYEVHYSYMHKNECGSFMYDTYMSKFQRPPLYGRADNLHRVTEWNFVELEKALYPFESLIGALLGFTFNSSCAKYTKRKDYTEPGWRAGLMVSASDENESDTKWEEGESTPLLYDAFFSELQALMCDPKTKRYSKNDCLYSFTTITTYVRYLHTRDKKLASNTGLLQFAAIINSHKRLLELVFCGSENEEDSGFSSEPAICYHLQKTMYMLATR
jgi:hypothetical protein